MKSASNIIAVIGLMDGAIFGMLGTIVNQPNLRASFWALDAVGLIVAAAILSLKFFRKERDIVAAGFLVFAIGEAVMLSGTAGSLEQSVPAFAAGTALWSAGLLLASVPREFAAWVRMAGMVAAVLFAITSARIFHGEPILPISSPLPFFAYPVLVLTFAGWIWTLLRAT